MNKYIAALTIVCLPLSHSFAIPHDSNPLPADSSRVIDIEEVVVVASPKENFKLREQPTAVTLFSRDNMKELGINSIKNLTSHARNLFIPDYGSRMTSAVYIRGIGSRINTPAVGLYVDNMPCADKSAFDFFMLDIDRIDVLNGPQSTLYGRNAMGGIVRVFTTNPMRKQGTTINIGATGRTTGRRISAITHHKLNDQFAFSLGGYYSGENGFFRNDSTKHKADEAEEAGARLRAIYKPLKRLSFDLQFNYNYTDQGAYPYYYTGNTPATQTQEAYPQYIGKLTANQEGRYRRNLWNAGLSGEYKFNRATLSSVTSWQFLQDRMFMDQDFLAADIYTLGQRQRNQSISEELTYKTTDKSRWQSTTGLFFLHQNQHTTTPVSFHQDGMDMLNNKFAQVLPSISQENPYTHQQQKININLALTDPSMTFNGKFRTPVTNYALFHQSTIKDFIDNFSLTLGLRIDMEHHSLDYDMRGNNINYQFSTTMSQPVKLSAYPLITGQRKDDYIQLLPKAALQYNFANHKGNIYFSFSKGFRSGGYNIQMFSELIQTQMQGQMMQGVKTECNTIFQNLINNAKTEELRKMFTELKEKVNNNIPTISTPSAKTLRYKPEYSLNYELGTHLNLLNTLQIDAAVFYMSTNNQQISRFSANGLGRQMINAGRSACCGAELGLRSSLIDGKLDLSASYGFTHSEFRDYNNGKTDYKGKYVPFVPMHNMSVAANYTQPLKSEILRAISFGANLTGAGRIYWTEENTAWQDFYACLGAHITGDFKFAKLDVWAKNLTNSHYNVFYFESMNRGYEQHAAPCRFGADITFEF